MSEARQTARSSRFRAVAALVAALIALLILASVAAVGVLQWRTRFAHAPETGRLQHVAAPASFAELSNPFLAPDSCVVLEEVGSSPNEVQAVVERAVTNRNESWARQLVRELPRLIAESVSRPQAEALVAEIAAAGGKASAHDAIEHFLAHIASDRESAIGRPSEVLDEQFLTTGRDSIAAVRSAIASHRTGDVDRALAASAFIAFTTAEGRALYQVNCRPCHGTKGSGDGPLADGWSLRPVNFRAPDTLAALKPGEVLWRIEEGGPGLPPDATPWDSSMPAWKHELDRDLVWKIILGAFNSANVTPAAGHEHDHAHHAHKTSPPSRKATAKPRLPEKSWLDWPVPPRPTAEQMQDPGFAGRGKYLYYYRCMPCHGVAGRGDGPAADSMWPRPRDFGDIKLAGFDDQMMPPKFKFRTTRYGWLPTDQDLYRTISRGLVGTAMEGWSDVLEPQEIWQIIAHLKSFSKTWDDPEHTVKNPNDPIVVQEYTEPGEPGPIMDFVALTPPPLTAQLVADGASAFLKIGCWQCHGVEARGDGSALGQHHDVWDYRAWPQNLANPLNYKAGHTIQEIYRDITSGIDGSVMPTVPTESLDPNDAKRGDYLRWALAAYVSSIASDTIPASSSVRGPVLVRRTRSPLSADPLDRRWDELPATEILLSGQAIVPPRWPTPTVTRVMVKAMYNEDADSAGWLAIWLRWDDRRPNVSHEDRPAHAFSSEAWSLGPQTYLAPAGQPKSAVLFGCRDQLEIQFPCDRTSPDRQPPVLLGGASDPVVLWRWFGDRQGLRVTKEVVKIENSQADRIICAPASGTDGSSEDAVELLRSLGPDSEPMPIPESPRVRAVAQWANGAWTVVLTRSLTSGAPQDVSFRDDREESGRHRIRNSVPFAIHVWDGLAGEAGLQMAVSSWVYLMFQQRIPLVLGACLVVGALLSLVVLVGSIAWYRRTRRERKAS